MTLLEALDLTGEAYHRPTTTYVARHTWRNATGSGIFYRLHPPRSGPRTVKRLSKIMLPMMDEPVWEALGKPKNKESL